METKGKVNCYTCEKCGKKHITVNLADGVTPMFITCRSLAGCKGTAKSAMYQTDQTQWPEYVWRKPSQGEFEGLEEGMRQHILNGGLMLRRADNLELEAIGYRTRLA